MIDVSRRAVVAGLVGGSVASGLLAGAIALVEDDDEAGGRRSGGPPGETPVPIPNPRPTPRSLDWTYRDGFDRERSAILDGYEVVEGEADQFGRRRTLDGPTLRVRSPVSMGDATAVVDPDRRIWEGTGTVAVDFALDAESKTRSAVVSFGPRDALWEVEAGFGGDDDRLLLSAPGGEVVESWRVGGSRGVRPGTRHFLEVVVADDWIGVRTDVGSVVHGASPASDAGTVGVGLRSDESEGGVTWFDDLRVESPLRPVPVPPWSTDP